MAVRSIISLFGHFKPSIFIMKKDCSCIRVVIAAMLLAAVTSCSKNEKDNDFTYFLSLDENLTLSQTYITGFINSASATYTDLNSIKGYISSDVKVYNITYRTTAGGDEITGSGLVCLPSKPGEYPVICFMNGTNTVNAYCPTNFAINTQYQMVEIMASMGYVVVIPDYPGFGASAATTHPYLVSEPTVGSTVDMLYALKEIGVSGLPGITLKNEYFVMGYSQGGWAAMALHKALELDYKDDFSLAGSVCGAGPYDISFLFQNMINVTEYPMPVYICYIINAYSHYNQFTNPVADILNQQYAVKLPSLYNGTLDFAAINSQLTTSVSGLLTSDFLSGYTTLPKYESVRNAMVINSIAPYHTYKPLLLIHGGADTEVSPQVTDFFYSKMIEVGTSDLIIRKIIFPGLNHGEGAVPGMIEGVKFLKTIGK
jgi:pimeloyl-ACP methyl ester carboxylesterase